MNNYSKTGEASESKRTAKARSLLDENHSNAISGIGGGRKLEFVPSLIKIPGHKYIEGTPGVYMSMETDRIDSPETGNGGKGYPRAGAIRLVAGHFGASLKFYKHSDKKVIGANPNFNIDSSYIYLSQLSDVDENLGIADGSSGKDTKKSTAILKADGIRLVADRGVKIISSRLGSDSKREKQAIARGIDLIAGNDDSTLQALVKADNMSDALKDIYDYLGRVLEMIYHIVYYQSKANLANAGHEHTTNVPTFPTAPFSVDLITDNLAASGHFDGVLTPTIDLMKKELDVMRQDYTDSVGKKYIGSLYNHTN